MKKTFLFSFLAVLVAGFGGISSVLAMETVNVTTFPELKEALESNNDVKVVVDSFNNGSYYTLIEGIDFDRGDSAINIPAGTEKELEINTTIDCRAVNTNTDSLLYSFITNKGDLTIDGNGYLKVSFNASGYPNAIISNDGNLEVEGDVTLDARSQNVDTYGYAIWNYLGSMELKDGTFIGGDTTSVGGDSHAVYHDKNAKDSNILGGKYITYYLDGKIAKYAVAISPYFTKDTINLKISGGDIYGVKSSESYHTTIGDLLDNDCVYKLNGEVFDSSNVYETENRLKVERSNTITSITASIATPTDGDKVDGFPKPTIKNNNVTYYAHDWYDDNGSRLTSFDKFEGGHTYTLKIRVSTTKSFDNNTTAKVNGEEATVVTVDSNGKSMLFSYDFLVKSSVISSISTNITTPVDGGSLKNKPTFTTNGVTLYDYDWYQGDERLNKNSDTFKAGNTYRLKVRATAPSDGKFDNTTKATVNAKNATIESVADDNKTILYYYDFEIAGKEVVTSINTKVTAPTDGVSVSTLKPTISTSDVSLYAYDWYDNNGDKLTSYDKFEAGNTYRLKVRASTAAKQFTKDTKPTINDKNATVDSFDAQTILYYYDFTIAKEGTYTVTFDLDGGKMSSASSVSVKDGEKVSKPSKDPTKDDYKFEGWYSDTKLTKEFDFDTKITENTTIYAKWTSTKTEVKENENKDKEEVKDTEKKEEIKDTENKEEVKENNNFESNNEVENNTEKKAYNNGFSDEFNEAYEFAFKNGITTMDAIEKADMNGGLTRIAMAKMLSQYAINILGKTPDTSKTPDFKDVPAQLDADYNNGITLAYQLGIMGVGIDKFRPYDGVTRAEFGTALSRMLYGLEDGNPYYTTHLAKLKSEGIISNDDPDLKEVRGYVMIMLMRSAK